MEKTIEKFGIPILMAFILIMYFFNNIIGVNGKLIIVNYSIIFLIFLAWLISIIRTIKEKKKSKIIPCIIITIFAIISFILVATTFFPGQYIQILAQIGIGIFIYEIIDLFKIKFSKNIINISSLIIGIIIIITFLLSQLIAIGKYKKSINNIYNLITSPELTYEKLSNGLETLTLEHKTSIEYANEKDTKIFITPAYSCKTLYALQIEMIGDINIYTIKNRNTLKKNRQSLNEKAEYIINGTNDVFEAYTKKMFTTLAITTLEIIMLISLGILNNKQDNI